MHFPGQSLSAQHPVDGMHVVDPPDVHDFVAPVHE